MVGTSGSSRRRSLVPTADDLELAVAMQRHRRRRRVEHQVDVAGDDVVDGGAEAAVGHLHGLDVGEHLELHGREVADRADARRRGGDLSRIGLGARDQVLDGRALEALAQHQHVGAGGQQGDRGPARRVVGHVLVEEAVGGDRAGRGEQQRVAVGRRACHLGGADIAGGAADILHDRRLPPLAAELVGDEPRQRIGAAAGRVGHDDAHQPRREGLLRAARIERKYDGDRGQCHQTDYDPSHRRSPALEEL